MAITPSKTIFTKATSKSLFRAVPRMVAMNGKSAYELAVEDGFVGDETAWLASLQGDDGVQSSNNSVTDIVALTQAEYDLITPDATTFYIIKADA